MVLVVVLEDLDEIFDDGNTGTFIVLVVVLEHLDEIFDDSDTGTFVVLVEDDTGAGATNSNLTPTFKESCNLLESMS